MLFGASLLFVAGCKKESTDDGSGDNGALVVEKKQRSMVGYVTATWCGPCGAYGGPNFKKAIDEVGEDNITMLNIHTSSSKLTPYFKRPSSMNNPDSVYIAPVFGGIFNSLNIPTTSSETLNTAWQAASEDLYKATQGDANGQPGAQGDAASGASADGASSGEDEVQDVDFEEVK